MFVKIWKLQAIYLVCAMLIPVCLTSRISGRSRSSSRGAQSPISCFTCYSYNGSDDTCGDPFYPATDKLVDNCKQGWEGRFGLYYAKYCIKVKGTTWTDGSEMIVRSCSMKAMDNMCGHFRFDEVDYDGCMMSCNSDACNDCQRHVSRHILCLTAILFLLYLVVKV